MEYEFMYLDRVPMLAAETATAMSKDGWEQYQPSETVKVWHQRSMSGGGYFKEAIRMFFRKPIKTKENKEAGKVPENQISDKTMQLLETAAMQVDGAMGMQRRSVNQNVLDILKAVWYNGWLEGNLAAIKLEQSKLY